MLIVIHGFRYDVYYLTMTEIVQILKREACLYCSQRKQSDILISVYWSSWFFASDVVWVFP